MRCPTCRAAQEWSDSCRRCGSDLRLLRQCDQWRRRLRSQAIAALRDGRIGEAVDRARELIALSPDAQSWKLLAVCALANRDWETAMLASFNTEPTATKGFGP